MATRTLTLTTICPPAPARRDECNQCVRDRLLVTPGVRNVTFTNCDDPNQATLQLEYDPRLVPLHEIDAELRRAGVCCQSQRASVVLGIDGMASSRSERAIEAALAKLPGVVASASFASRSLRVEFDRTQCALPEIARRLDALGFRLRPGGPAMAKPQAAIDRKSLERLKELILTHHKLAMAAAGAILLLAAVLTRWLDGPPSLRYLFVAAGFVVAGWYTAIDTFQVLRRFQFDIDVLMFAAAFGAAALGYYEEGALLLVLFAFGGAGEELAIDKARQAIAALAKLAPDTATVRDEDGRERLVRVEELKVGTHVVVRPFDRVPADGVVESGASAIDQSPITGESAPVEKSAGSAVFAGTINGEGLLVVTVKKPAAETTLAKIVQLVQEAQTTKSPTQVFTDKVEKWYVPAVLLGTAALILVPPLAFAQAWSVWFYRAMAFLTAASPCALAIGTPAAVLSGIAQAARIGVLVKGGVHLENLGRIRVVAFDKTGTLTRGRPQVTDVIALDSVSADEVLALAACVERTSSHPLAEAIVGEARARGIALREATDAQQIAGQGVCATIDGRRIRAGRADMFNGHAATVADAAAAMARDGKSVVVIGIDDTAVGVIGLSDRPRPHARETIDRLHHLGVTHTIMLTGDHKNVAEQIAREIGVDEWHAELLPQDKLALVKQLEQRYGPLAMVGDGVNDAPALASATVGIAMGGAGTDVAIETADIALMADDLRKLPDAIALSRFSRRIIRQNLFIALGVIALLAPAAAMGFAYLGVAVLFHEGSTVVVVLNSMRLLFFKPR
ncbi:MAG: Zn2+/Cd2+-exporting ATPase [Humisphaera sp.]|nr:Zn2+/Cd2+-exporting ATPase [Humisphaera sp.]